MSKPPVRLKSRGYNLWKEYESKFGPITLDEIAKKTGLTLVTVRTFVAKSSRDKDIYAKGVGPAYVLATFFGATLNDTVSVSEDAK